jgi:hypothetical protein
MEITRGLFWHSTKMPCFVGAFFIAFGITAEAQNSDTKIHLGFDLSMDQVSPTSHPVNSSDEVWLTLHTNGSIEERHSWGGETDNHGARLGRAINAIASWHVRSSNIIERFQSFPNNTRSWQVSVDGASCKLSVVDKLRPGKREYTFPTPGTHPLVYHYFENYRVTRTFCTIQ